MFDRVQPAFAEQGSACGWSPQGVDHPTANTYQIVFYGAGGQSKQAVEVAGADDALVLGRIRGLHYANAVEVYRDGRLLERVEATLIAS